MDHEGGCFCGNVRYRTEGRPLDVVHCHCEMCRRTAGAPFVTWVTVRDDAFSWIAGEPKLLQSSERAERTFCGDCGSPLTFRSQDRRDEVDVTLATMDRPEDHAPARHVWTSRRLVWVKLADGLPEHREESR